MFESKPSVGLIQLTNVFSTDSSDYYLLPKAALSSSDDKELKLLVTNYLTVVSRPNASELVTLCSEPGSSTTFKVECYFIPLQVLSRCHKVSETIK